MMTSPEFNSFISSITPYANQFPPMILKARREVIDPAVKSTPADSRIAFVVSEVLDTLQKKYKMPNDLIDKFMGAHGGHSLAPDAQLEHLKEVYAILWILGANNLQKEFKAAVAAL